MHICANYYHNVIHPILRYYTHIVSFSQQIYMRIYQRINILNKKGLTRLIFIRQVGPFQSQLLLDIYMVKMPDVIYIFLNGSVG